MVVSEGVVLSSTKLAHCRNFGARATRPSHDEDRRVYILAISPKLLGWIPSLSAGNLKFFHEGIGFAQREELSEERRGTLVPCADGFLVLIKPLFLLPQEGERKQAEPNGISLNAPYSYSLAELQEVLEMGVCVLIRLATEWTSLHHVYEAGLQLKVHVLNINIGFSCHIGS